MEVKICNFLPTLFRNKDFTSQESPILADVENMNYIFLHCDPIVMTHPIYIAFYLLQRHIVWGSQERQILSFFFSRNRVHLKGAPQRQLC